MEWILNAKEMKSCDSNTIEYYGIPSLVLMERAALKTVEFLEENHCNLKKVLAVCGTGNNGGDGLAVARLLHLKGIQVEALILGDKKKFTKETQSQYHTCLQYHVPIIEHLDRDDYTVVLDALFGIGLTRNLEGEYARLIEQLNELSCEKIAIDIPSGISADNGSVIGIAFRADATVTFAYRKLGHVFYPGNSYTGELSVADIGIDRHSWLEKRPGTCAFTKEDLSGLLIRKPDGNKGTFGKVLIVAGTAGMAGAAYFSAKAAYKSGCGLVRIYTSEENRIILQTKLPEAIITTYSGKRLDTSQLIEALAWADVIVAGPGLGSDDTAEVILQNILKNAAVPVVLDADALNLIARDSTVLRKPHTDIVVTPHLGEMSRLSNVSISYLKENLITAAEEFSREYNVICVLKDAKTVTAVPYGKTYLNISGNDGMATGGSGDVLSGVIGGLIAQGIRAEEAAPAGVYWHGLAGEAASAACGCHGTLASDIIEGLDGALTLKNVVNHTGWRQK